MNYHGRDCFATCLLDGLLLLSFVVVLLFVRFTWFVNFHWDGALVWIDCLIAAVLWVVVIFVMEGAEVWERGRTGFVVLSKLRFWKLKCGLWAFRSLVIGAWLQRGCGVRGKVVVGFLANVLLQRGCGRAGGVIFGAAVWWLYHGWGRGGCGYITCSITCRKRFLGGGNYGGDALLGM